MLYEAELARQRAAESGFDLMDEGELGAQEFVAGDGVPVASPSEIQKQAEKLDQNRENFDKDEQSVSMSPAEAKRAVDAQKAPVASWFTAAPDVVGIQLHEMRAWVDWVCEVYRFTEKEAVPCWYLHTELALEWMGMWHLFQLSFSPEDSGSGPNNFHYWLDVFRVRIGRAKDRLQCTALQHVEPRPPAVDVTRVSAEEWKRLTGHEYSPAPRWPRFAGVEEEAAHE